MCGGWQKLRAHVAWGSWREAGDNVSPQPVAVGYCTRLPAVYPSTLAPYRSLLSTSVHASRRSAMKQDVEMPRDRIRASVVRLVHWTSQCRVSKSCCTSVK